MLFPKIKVFEKWSEKMDVLIRDIEPTYIKEIDKKADEYSKRLGRRFSRNEYIKMLIQNDCELRLTELTEQKFDNAIDEVVTAMKREETTLQRYIDSNSRLFHLMASGIDISEGEDK